MRWLGSENKTSSKSNPIILKEFVHTKYSVLCDNTIGQNVIVEAHNGVPFCKTITQMTVDTLDLLYFLNRNMRQMGVLWNRLWYRLESLLHFLYLTLFSILKIW
jgi:hypothetical protein